MLVAICMNYRIWHYFADLYPKASYFTRNGNVQLSSKLKTVEVFMLVSFGVTLSKLF